MKKVIDISAVSYLNTKPFIEGLSSFEHTDYELRINLDIPSQCARNIINGTADIGLVPIASVPLIHNAKVISSYCIGSNGPVKTVALFSNDPIDECESILMDYQSMTSVLLTKYLMKHYWKKQPVFLPSERGYEKKCSKNQAALIIGDRTMDFFDQFKYVYDLSEAWYNHTQKPFVFAVWITNKTVPDSFVKSFDIALKRGMDNKVQLSKKYASLYPNFDVERYFTQYIDYAFDAEKKESMDQILNFMKIVQY